MLIREREPWIYRLLALWVAFACELFLSSGPPKFAHIYSFFFFLANIIFAWAEGNRKYLFQKQNKTKNHNFRFKKKKNNKQNNFRLCFQQHMRSLGFCKVNAILKYCYKNNAHGSLISLIESIVTIQHELQMGCTFSNLKFCSLNFCVFSLMSMRWSFINQIYDHHCSLNGMQRSEHLYGRFCCSSFSQYHYKFCSLGRKSIGKNQTLHTTLRCLLQ